MSAENKINRLLQNVLMSSGKIDNDKNYWIDKLKSCSTRSSFSVNTQRHKLPRYDMAVKSKRMPESISKSIISMCNGSEYAMYILLLSCVKFLLFKYTGNQDSIIGMPAFSQKDKTDCFDNILPIRSILQEQYTFKDWANEIKTAVSEADKHQNLPLEELVKIMCTDMESEEAPVFNTIVLLENIHDTGIVEDIKADAVFAFKLDENSIDIRIEYNSCLFTEQAISLITEQMTNYYDLAAANPNIRLWEMDVIPESEKFRILRQFNNTKAEYQKDKTIHEMFEEQAAKTPNNIAAIFERGMLTYRELNEKSNQLARALLKKGAAQGSIIAVMLERSIDMIVGIMGILKAGCAYLPISPEYPSDRINYMLNDSYSKIMLTVGTLKEGVIYNGILIDLEDESIYDENGTNLGKIASSSLAYVIYTSGSTGRPKGVMIEHYSVVNRISWMQKRYPIGESDTILQKTPFTFDVSVWELFWWSFYGAKVFFLKQGGEKNPKEIVNAIENENITVIHFVPSMLSSFLDYIEVKGVSYRLKSLRQVFSSGEVLGFQHVESFNKLLNKACGTKLTNLYGPTEATVDVSFFDCPSGGELKVIPIGKPIDNIKLYVVDKCAKLQPVEVAGELCISGDGVGRGYLNREELTAERFTDDPFDHGRTLYKTGDLARWMADGNIEYLGRIDNQVKIRGFRIELGEIEAHILSMRKVSDAVVIDRQDKEGEKYLSAYIVSSEPISQDELRADLLKELPEYMVPAYFIRLDEMPLTANGKINRKALPEPEGFIEGEKQDLPENENQRRILEVWKNVLGRENIGINDDFFESGGHSLQAIKLEVEMEKSGMPIDYLDINKYRTIKELALFVEGKGKV